MANTLGVNHPDDPNIYISSEEDILLIIQVSDALVENDHKPALFHVNSF